MGKLICGGVVGLALALSACTQGQGSSLRSTTLAVTAGPINLLTNGDFEAGDSRGWTTKGAVTVGAPPHSGSFAAELGDPNSHSRTSTLSQSVSLPRGNDGQISLWYQFNTSGSSSNARLEIDLVTTIAGTGLQLTTTLFNTNTPTDGWVHLTGELPFPGETSELVFENHAGSGAGDATTLVDDVVISVPLADAGPVDAGSLDGGSGPLDAGPVDAGAVAMDAGTPNL